MITNLNKIADEWSYRVGVIDYEDEKHLYHLNNILMENGWSHTVIDEFVHNLNEGVITLPNIVLNEGSNQDATLNTAMMETAALIGTTGVSQQKFIDLL